MDARTLRYSRLLWRREILLYCISIAGVTTGAFLAFFPQVSIIDGGFGFLAAVAAMAGVAGTFIGAWREKAKHDAEREERKNKRKGLPEIAPGLDVQQRRIAALVVAHAFLNRIDDYVTFISPDLRDVPRRISELDQLEEYQDLVQLWKDWKDRNVFLDDDVREKLEYIGDRCFKRSNLPSDRDQIQMHGADLADVRDLVRKKIQDYSKI